MRSKRTKAFKKMFERLPEAAQELSRQAFAFFRENPYHPILVNHPLNDDGRGRHRKGSRAVSISGRYRSIYVVVKDDDGVDVALWYWTGTHEAYNNFIGDK